MYCGNCGKELKSNAKFCFNCGESVAIGEEEFTRDDKKSDSIVNGENKQEETTSENVNLQDGENKKNEKANDINEEGSLINSEGLIDGIKEDDHLEFMKRDETSGERKSFKKILLSISVLVIVVLGMFFVNNKSKNVESVIGDIEKTLASFDEYILDDYKQDVDVIKDRLSAQEEEKNYEKTKVLLADTEELKAKLGNYNNTTMGNLLYETRSKDITRAYGDELETIKKYEEKVNKYINDGKFISARNVLNEWNVLIASINYSYDNYAVSVNQIDFNSFPKIKVYLSIEDKNTKIVPKNLDSGFFYISEKNANNKFLKQTIEKVTQLDQQEGLNINMVADVSGSMDNGPIGKAKYIMTNFLDQVQFNIKDKVELTTFSSGVRTNAAFTDNREVLRTEINNLTTGDSTALYDALFAAVNTTAVQNGAKCVMAFTDGQDNYSKVTPKEVIEVSKRYNVPVFIIGVGSSLDDAVLGNIASSTNGLYTQINDISDMSNLYKKIYKQNKEMYLLEYETQEKNDLSYERALKIDVQTRKEGGGTSYAFTPRLLVSTLSEISNSDEISELISNYLNGFVKSMNNNDYSHVEKYLVPGGGVEKEVKPYVLNNIQEKLLSLEIINKEFKDANTCIVTTRETYEVQNHDDPLHMRVLEGKYEVKKQSDGKWKILNFADQYKIISKLNY